MQHRLDELAELIETDIAGFEDGNGDITCEEEDFDIDGKAVRHE